ncbi:MAG TPA: SDR family oxidoreductase [Gammaproteobacteria bacterium]|nr:SDR family oxidoreductase [Gammaproteobacteria bacterium]
MPQPSRDTLTGFTAPDAMLDEQIILITGAAAGIGAALARQCAALGGTTILLDKDLAGLEKLYDEIEAAGHPQPILHPLDLGGATPDDYAELAETIDAQLGRLDALTLNAGWLGAYTPFTQCSVDLYQKTMMVNLHGHFFLTQACLPLLQNTPDSRIVISTHAADTAYSGPFGMAKAGLASMLKILAHELDGDKRVRVNGVDTGPVNTAMRRLNFPGEEASRNPDPEAVINPYLFFLSPDSRDITGMNFSASASS